VSFNWARLAIDAINSCGIVVLVTVICTRGSVPRETGTKMLVTQSRVFGTIGGGNFEFIIINQCRKMISKKTTQVRTQHYPLGPITQQCCGGAVSVSLEVLSRDELDFLHQVYSIFLNKMSANIRSVLSGYTDKTIESPPLSSSGLYDDCGVKVRSEISSVKDLKVGHFIDPITPEETPIFIFGAGHVGRAVIDVLAPLQFLISWFDSRAEFAIEHRDAAVRPTISKVPTEEVPFAPSDCYYLVFTHSHPLDYELTREILKRGDAAFCGLIGSQTKNARFRKRLAAELDISSEHMSRLTCPIGIGSIKNKHPQAIAISVAAQLLHHVEGSHHANT
jgi:xanthine dehydrogenase accessory factor